MKTKIQPLKVSKDMRMRDFSNQFSSLFPYLKIEFFTKKHDKNQGSPRSEMITENLKINDIGYIIGDGTLWISGNATVAEFEEHIKSRYGLYIQVFWKLGKVWLETISYDSWTLETINEHAQERAQIPQEL